MTTTERAGRTTYSGSHESLEALYPVLHAEACESERLRRPTPRAQAALRTSGVIGLMMPQSSGGWGADPIDIIEVIDHVSYADPAAGWLVRALVTESAIAATHLPTESATELFAGSDPAVASGFSCGQRGRGHSLPGGGLRIDGRWRFAPGISMATHVNLPVQLEETGEHLVCTVPRWQVTVDDRWEMLGLRGSAAFDIQASDLVVPQSMTYTLSPGSARPGSVVAALTPVALASMNHGAWSQGLARRMLDELRDLALRSPSGEGPGAAAGFYDEFAQHYAAVASTNALLRDAWRASSSMLAREGRLEDEQQTMVRLAAIAVSRSALEVSQAVHRLAGAHVARDGALQRLFRDAHTGAQHHDSAHDVLTQIGRSLVSVPGGNDPREDRR